MMMKKIEKITTAFIALFLFLPGLEKFTDKFSYNFATQIKMAQLPFPKLSFVVGQTSELVVGFLAIILLFFYNKLKPEIRQRLFYFVNIMVFPIMLVALYVHAVPEVPTEVLPFEFRPPVLALLLLLSASINLKVHNRKEVKA